MTDRVVEQDTAGKPRLLRVAVVTPAAVLLVLAIVVGEWACAPRVPVASLRAQGSAAFAGAPAELQMAPQAPAAAPVQPAQQPVDANTLAQLDAQLAAAIRAPLDEARIRERESRAAAVAFPVERRLELSSTMYCLKGEMRTGVRTRDGMAAGDPRVLPLGSVVRVARTDGTPIGIFVIMDTGGAIRGNDIDLYVDSCREAERWGRHPVVAEVLDIGMQR